MKAHIIALSAVAVVSLAGNGYLYHQLNQLNTSCEALNSSYTAANAEYAEQVKLGETLAKEAENLKAEIAKKEALAAQATKTVADEEVIKQAESEEKPAQTSTSDDKWAEILTPHEIEVKNSVAEKIRANKTQKNDAHYDGPLANTFFHYLTTEEQEVYLKVYTYFTGMSREEAIRTLAERYENLNRKPTEFVCEGNLGQTGGPVSSIWA